MSIETYLAYLATVLLFFAHPPGPSQLLYMARSMEHGAGKALPTVAGDLSANAIQIAIAGFGLVGLIHLSADFFLAVKWLGVAYLVWMGIKVIRDSSKTRAVPKPVSGNTMFFQGFITSAANPYAVVFFASLFPLFINPAADVAFQVAVLGGTYLIVDGLILLAMGATASRLVSALGSRFAVWTGRISGVFLIIAAILLSFKEPGPMPGVSKN